MSLTKGSSAQKLWTPANVVTIIRIICVPIFVAIMLLPWETWMPHVAFATMAKPWICAAVFLLVSATDCVDGYLARSRNEVTNFGKFMDPLADKLLVIAAFLVMTETGLLPSWVTLIVLFREFLVSGLRMMAATKGVVIAASWYGKAKTVSQMIAITLFILVDALPQLFGLQYAHAFLVFAWLVLVISLVLTILSMVDYFVKGKDVFADDSAPASSDLILAEDDTDIALPTKEQVYALAEETLAKARAKTLSLGTAESLTGGLVSAALTAVPGSSDTFLGGVSSYAYSVKSGVLAVSEQLLATDGAVNAQTAAQMALGCNERLASDVSVAVTGIAGPGGAEPDKPVGTVWIACAFEGKAQSRRFVFSGDREHVRAKTVAAALLLLQQAIDEA